ncbi:MAG: hypothetical protein HKN20_08705 [Gemmatimonadetes bacterium]|nr:hypothetical protein [Gemmatimonadota bacterium]
MSSANIERWVRAGTRACVHGGWAVTILLLGASCGDDGGSVVDPAYAPPSVASSKVFDPVSDFDAEPLRPVRFTDDPGVFFAEAGPLQLITFASLPWFGTSCDPAPPFEALANPLVVQGVTFSAPGCLESFLCPRPPCETVNTTLHLSRGARVEFPAGVTAAMLKLEGMPAGRVLLVIEDGEGGTIGYTGELYEALPTYVGIRSDREIGAIRYWGSSSFLQKLVVSDLWYEGGTGGEFRGNRRGLLASRSG